jgi:hypothetical protein
MKPYIKIARLANATAALAGAAVAAAQENDDWESPVTAFRGRGPARELCFVITCRECSRGK